MKLGLTLEGGANRTVFSCGVMDALLDEGIMADYIIGTSAGIAYALSYASKQKGRNYIIAEKYLSDKRYMGFKHMLNPKNRSYFNLDFVFDYVPNNLVPFDYDTFREYSGEVVAVVTNINTGKSEYLNVPRDDTTFMALRASCALPLMFKKIRIGDKYYMDGGLSDSIPFEHAVECGCDKNIVVLTREYGYKKGDESAVNLIEKCYRKYPELIAAVKNRAQTYNDCVNRLEKLEREGQVFVIRPKNMGDFKRTERDSKKLTSLYKEGFCEAKKSIVKLREYLQINCEN